MDKIIVFDRPFIGIPNIKRGYRIESDWDFFELVNVLSEKYGEGVTSENLTIAQEWAIIVRRLDKRIICIVDSLDKLEFLKLKFNLTSNINEEFQIKFQIRNIISKFLFEKKTQKRLRRICQEISELIGCGWYDIKISPDLSVLHIPYNGYKIKIDI